MGSNVEDHVGIGLPLLGRSRWAYGLVGAWGLNLEAHVGVGLPGLERSLWALPSVGSNLEAHVGVGLWDYSG